MRHLLITLSNPVHGREAEFNDWYDNQHLGDMLSQNGFVAAQRFEVADAVGTEDVPYRYMTLFELEDDMSAAVASVEQIAQNQSLVMTEARGDVRAAWWFTAVTERRESLDANTTHRPR